LTEVDDKCADEERSIAMQPLPKITVLKIDKDCYVHADWIKDWIHIAALPICNSFGLRVNYIRMTKTRKGLHYYIGISPPVHADLANRLHWLLGDDCRRVDFNRARIKVGYANWSKLFEQEDARIIQLYPCKVAAAALQLQSRGDTHS
jgi:hypothetical protein